MALKRGVPCGTPATERNNWRTRRDLWFIAENKSEVIHPKQISSKRTKLFCFKKHNSIEWLQMTSLKNFLICYKGQEKSSKFLETTKWKLFSVKQKVNMILTGPCNKLTLDTLLHICPVSSALKGLHPKHNFEHTLETQENPLKTKGQEIARL